MIKGRDKMVYIGERNRQEQIVKAARELPPDPTPQQVQDVSSKYEKYGVTSTEIDDKRGDLSKPKQHHVSAQGYYEGTTPEGKIIRSPDKSYVEGKITPLSPTTQEQFASSLFTRQGKGMQSMEHGGIGFVEDGRRTTLTQYGDIVKAPRAAYVDPHRTRVHAMSPKTSITYTTINQGFSEASLNPFRSQARQEPTIAEQRQVASREMMRVAQYQKVFGVIVGQRSRIESISGFGRQITESRPVQAVKRQASLSSLLFLSMLGRQYKTKPVQLTVKQPIDLVYKAVYKYPSITMGKITQPFIPPAKQMVLSARKGYEEKAAWVKRVEKQYNMQPSDLGKALTGGKMAMGVTAGFLSEFQRKPGNVYPLVMGGALLSGAVGGSKFLLQSGTKATTVKGLAKGFGWTLGGAYAGGVALEAFSTPKGLQREMIIGQRIQPMVLMGLGGRFDPSKLYKTKVPTGKVDISKNVFEGGEIKTDIRVEYAEKTLWASTAPKLRRKPIPLEFMDATLMETPTGFKAIRRQGFGELVMGKTKQGLFGSKGKVLDYRFRVKEFNSERVRDVFSVDPIKLDPIFMKGMKPRAITKEVFMPGTTRRMRVKKETKAQPDYTFDYGSKKLAKEKGLPTMFKIKELGKVWQRRAVKGYRKVSTKIEGAFIHKEYTPRDISAQLPQAGFRGIQGKAVNIFREAFKKPKTISVSVFEGNQMPAPYTKKVGKVFKKDRVKLYDWRAKPREDGIERAGYLYKKGKGTKLTRDKVLITQGKAKPSGIDVDSAIPPARQKALMQFQEPTTKWDKVFGRGLTSQQGKVKVKRSRPVSYQRQSTTELNKPFLRQGKTSQTLTQPTAQYDIYGKGTGIKPITIQQPTQSQRPLRAQTPIQSQSPIQAQSPIMGQRVVQSQRGIQSQRPIQSQHPVQAQTPIQSQRPVQIQRPILGQRSVQSQRVVHWSKPVQRNRPIIWKGPPDITKVIIPLPRLFSKPAPVKKKKGQGFIQFKYQPSLGPTAKGIFGSRPKVLTGLEPRYI